MRLEDMKKITPEDLSKLRPDSDETTKNTKKHLREYLSLTESDVEKIKLLTPKDLPSDFRVQYNFLHDERLQNVTIAIIPDNLWVKGDQPSESTAEKPLVMIKQSYFRELKNPDEIAWLCHELAHCQSCLDSESPEEYKGAMGKPAFDDLQSEYTYPNNPVEQHAFTKQFQFLKKNGKSREEISTLLSKYYSEADFPFFNRLLDQVYDGDKAESHE
jgi:hypothetical protein